MISLDNFAWFIRHAILRIRNVFDPFWPNGPSLYPLKTSKNFGFLTFSGGIEIEHWGKMGCYLELSSEAALKSFVKLIELKMYSLI